MCNSLALFISIEYSTAPHRSVKLGDSKAKCPIRGVGTIMFTVKGKTICLHNVLFVPDLDVSLYSVKQHMMIPGCYEHSENNTCSLAFPTFMFDDDTAQEIQFHASKPKETDEPDFDSSNVPTPTSKQVIPYHFE